MRRSVDLYFLLVDYNPSTSERHDRNVSVITIDEPAAAGSTPTKYPWPKLKLLIFDQESEELSYGNPSKFDHDHLQEVESFAGYSSRQFKQCFFELDFDTGMVHCVFKNLDRVERSFVTYEEPILILIYPRVAGKKTPEQIHNHHLLLRRVLIISVILFFLNCRLPCNKETEVISANTADSRLVRFVWH